MNSYIHVGGLVNDDLEEHDEEDMYIIPIKNWIQGKKHEYKNRYLLNNNDSSTNVIQYKDKLEKLGKDLLKAFHADQFDIATLEKNGWPKDLIECMKDSAVSTPVLYSIEASFIEFPHSENPEYVEKVLKPENEKLSLE